MKQFDCVHCSRYRLQTLSDHSPQHQSLLIHLPSCYQQHEARLRLMQSALLRLVLISANEAHPSGDIVLEPYNRQPATTADITGVNNMKCSSV